jgi:hypothetical protein
MTQEGASSYQNPRARSSRFDAIFSDAGQRALATEAALLFVYVRDRTA